MKKKIDFLKPFDENTPLMLKERWFWCREPVRQQLSSNMTMLGHMSQNRSRHIVLGNAGMGGITRPDVLSRHFSFWVPFVLINGTRPGSSAFPLLWRSQKMDRFGDRLKRRIVFSGWYPSIAKTMGHLIQ